MRDMNRNGLFMSIILTIYLVMVSMVAQVQAEEPILSEPINGVQVSLSPTKEIYQRNEEIELTLTLTNVSDESIEIDPWPGYWFVQISDEQWHIMPYVRSNDVIREKTKTIVLKPGEQWDTIIKELSLTTGLEGSTPLWEYEPLEAGTYWVGADYIAYDHPDFPNMWIGGANCELIQIKIVDVKVTGS